MDRSKNLKENPNPTQPHPTAEPATEFENGPSVPARAWTVMEPSLSSRIGGGSDNP